MLEPSQQHNLDTSHKRKSDVLADPSYVITMPLKISLLEDDAETSDGASDDETFPPNYFKNPQKHFRINRELRGAITKDLPEVIAKANFPKNEDANVSHVVSCYRDEAFGENKQQSAKECQERLAISFGLNAVMSLSRKRNTSHMLAMCRPIQASFAVKQFEFFWRPQWEESVDSNKWQPVAWEKPKKFYRQLKKRNKAKAKNFRQLQENPIKTSEPIKANKMVPYREIREKIKNHAQTKLLVKQLRKKRPNTDVYLGIADADLVSLRAGKQGSYSHYDEMVKAHYQQTGHKLEIGSVGYTIPKTAEDGSLIQPLLALGVELDLWVRHETAKIFPRGVYYPEPSSIVRIQQNKETVTESFLEKEKYSSPQEMQILVGHVIEQRSLDPKMTMRFDATGAMVTQMPERMMRERLNACVNKQGLIVRWTARQLKSLRSLNQSHYDNFSWAKNLLLGLPTWKPKEKMANFRGNTCRLMLISLISRVFKAYDVISQVELEMQRNPTHLGFQKIFIAQLNHVRVAQIATRKRDNKCNTPAEIKYWAYLDQINSIQKLKDEINHFFPDRENIAKEIEQAAIEANVKVVECFQKKLCRDFGMLSKQLLFDLFEEQDPDGEALVIGQLAPPYEKILHSESDKMTAKDFSRDEKSSLFGSTPMHWAAMVGDKKLVQDFKKETKKSSWIADVNKAAAGNVYPLHCAIYYCATNGTDPQLLKELCTPEAVTAKTASGQTAIYMMLVQLEDVNKILDSALSLYQYEDDETPCKEMLLVFAQHVSLPYRESLLLAVMRYFPSSPERNQLIDFLIKQGTSLNTEGKLLKSEHFPTDHDDNFLFNRFMDQAGSYPLFEAIRQNDVALVASLLKAGAKHAITIGDGQQPVILYAMYHLENPLAMVRLLLEHNVDPNASDAEKIYPLREAIDPQYGRWAEHEGIKEELIRLIAARMTDEDIADEDCTAVRHATGRKLYNEEEKYKKTLYRKRMYRPLACDFFAPLKLLSDDEEDRLSESSSIFTVRDEEPHPDADEMHTLFGDEIFLADSDAGDSDAETSESEASQKSDDEDELMHRHASPVGSDSDQSESYVALKVDQYDFDRYEMSEEEQLSSHSETEEDSEVWDGSSESDQNSAAVQSEMEEDSDGWDWNSELAQSRLVFRP